MPWSTPKSVLTDPVRKGYEWVPELTEPLVAPGAERARSRYQPDEKRHGTALCLSGGGYRAALFHMGALRRLDELGVLGQVDTFTSVSGGSILAAVLADRIAPALDAGNIAWPTTETILDWQQEIRDPLVKFTSENIRTLWILQMLWPGSWPASTVAVRSLEEHYLSLSTLRLDELPTLPRFIFCSTDLAFATAWLAERAGVGDYEAGYAPLDPSWPVARAVAASSCFPPVFNPLPIGLRPEQLQDGLARPRPDRGELIRGLRLSDGGVYDNLGVEPVWKDHQRILVSDGGGSLDFEPDRGFFKRPRRYLAITEAQGTEVRKRWLISSFLDGTLSGTYWGIGSSPQAYEERALGYSQSLVDQVIATIRTDLDAFSDAEQCVLENHGYLMADAAIHTHAPELVRPDAPAPRVPNRDWMNEGRVRLALAKSSKRRLFGRWRRVIDAARGTPQEAPAESVDLLNRYRPVLQYDSHEYYFADSPAVMTNFAAPGSGTGSGLANRLLRGDGKTVIAAAGAKPGDDSPALTLDFLGEEQYANEESVLATDYIDEQTLDTVTHTYRADAKSMHEHADFADVCFGHARLDGSGHLWLQYWFFSYYDEFDIVGPVEGGLHEGDWEMIQLRIGRGDRVVEATYAQHNYCQAATWDELEHVESEHGAVPLVYCAVGSHASYMRVGDHRAPVGLDHNDGEGRRVRPRLEVITDDKPGWVLWPGIWGGTRKKAWWDSDSPRGPRQHMQWFDPAAFAAHARPAPATAPGDIAGIELPPPPQRPTPAAA